VQPRVASLQKTYYRNNPNFIDILLHGAVYWANAPQKLTTEGIQMMFGRVAMCSSWDGPFARTKGLLSLVAALLFSVPAPAQPLKVSDGVVRIGLLNDASGREADVDGAGSALAARMAAEEFGNKVLGVPVEIVTADHQNSADHAATVARGWYDVDKVDMISVPTSSVVALSVQALLKDRNRILLHNGAATDLTGKQCSPKAAGWGYTGYSNASTLANAVLKLGVPTFTSMVLDFSAGHALADEFRKLYEAKGGKVVKEIRFPINTPDFSSFLLQAQASGSKGIVVAASGSDFINSLKQAAEFGILKNQAWFEFAINLNDIVSVGLDTMQGVYGVSAYEWSRNEESREWAKRFLTKTGRYPSFPQASTYSQVRNYLRAVEAAGTDDALTVMAKLRELPINDAYASNGRLRSDGQMIHDLNVVQVKSPSESKDKGDLVKLIQVVSGEDAFIPLSNSACPLVQAK
jgi:branched-chain amino acid transport system substrate-binding protein